MKKHLEDTHKYDDIITRPHPVSDHHARMTNYDRAAQFSPFAALTGFEGEIAETARLTDSMTELTDTVKEELNALLQQLLLRIKARPGISVTYFQADSRKSGGAYITAVGNLKKIDDVTHRLLLTDGTSIPIASILNIRETE